MPNSGLIINSLQPYYATWRHMKFAIIDLGNGVSPISPGACRYPKLSFLSQLDI